MTDAVGDSGLHIDDDWKAEAAREKERLTKQEKQEKPKRSAPGVAEDEASFVELINTLAIQVVIGLGGMQGPGGERIPPNPFAARHYIDLLEILQKKTEGNLSGDEQKTLEAVLYELRMQYVQLVTHGIKPPPEAPDAK